MRRACQKSVFNSLIFDKNILSPNIENHDSDVISLNVQTMFYFQISYLFAQWIIRIYFINDTTNDDDDDAKIKAEIF